MSEELNNVVELNARRGHIEVLQCDLDFEEELREAYRLNGPVVSLIAEFREECKSPRTLDTEPLVEWMTLRFKATKQLADQRRAFKRIADIAGSAATGSRDRLHSALCDICSIAAQWSKS